MKNIFTYIPCEVIHLAQGYYFQGLRDYHDWDHIVDLIAKANRFGIKLTLAQELAILFHDIVYIPGCQYNEICSADLLVACCKDTIRPELLAEACVIIQDTKDHVPTIRGSAIVSDLDMLVLSDEREFADSHLAIYNEYKHLVPSYDAFIKHRKIWANDALRRAEIFYSPQFKHLNSVAKHNLTQFIKTS